MLSLRHLRRISIPHQFPPNLRLRIVSNASHFVRVFSAEQKNSDPKSWNSEPSVQDAPSAAVPSTSTNPSATFPTYSHPTISAHGVPNRPAFVSQNHPKQRPSKVGNYALYFLLLSGGSIATALWWEESNAPINIAESIMLWKSLPRSSLLLPQSFVPQISTMNAIGDFLRRAIAETFNAPSSTGNSAPPRIFGLYGIPLSGKACAMRAAIGQLVREASISDESKLQSAQPLSDSSTQTATKHAKDRPSWQFIDSIFPSSTSTSISSSSSSNVNTVRVVYLPVGDNFKVARRVVLDLATMLNYRPLYFRLIHFIPDHLRFDSAASDLAAMMRALETAALLLRDQHGVRVVVVAENLQHVVTSQHRLLLGPQLIAGGDIPADGKPKIETLQSGSDSSSVVSSLADKTPSTQVRKSRSTTPTISAVPGSGYVNLNSAMQGATDGDALIANLVDCVHRATQRNAYAFVFTSSSPILALQYKTALKDRLQLYHQRDFTLNEARALAQKRQQMFCEAARQDDEIRIAEELDKLGQLDQELREWEIAQKKTFQQGDHGPTGIEDAQSQPKVAPPPALKSWHPDFLFSGAHPIRRNQQGVSPKVRVAESDGTHSRPGQLAKLSDSPEFAHLSQDEKDHIDCYGRGIRLPTWNEDEFLKIVNMVGLSPIFIHSTFTSQFPLEQAKRVLGARFMSMTPYLFTNNFALEEAWQEGYPTLRKLIANRCRTSQLLERIYSHSHSKQAYQSLQNSDHSNLTERQVEAVLKPSEPGQAVSDMDLQVHRDAACVLDRGQTPGMPGFREISTSPLVTMMFESGMLDADIDDDSVRIATRAHVRAYERLRKRQLTTPEIEAACKSVVNTDSSEEQVVDVSSKLSLKLGKHNMWL